MSNPSLLNIPYRFKTSKLYSQIPETGLGDFTVTRATTPTANLSTRINANGFIELVNDNVPRLDYPLGGIGAGCPALLVEPSAQNFLIRSEEFNNSGAWTPIGLNAFGSGSVANSTGTLDPFGGTNSDYIQENSSPGTHMVLQIVAGQVSGTTVSFSVFMKAAERTRVGLFNNAGGGGDASFNLSAGTATLNAGVSAGIENYGNGWYRCRLTYTPNATGNFNAQVRILDASGNASYTGTGASGLYVFGAQVEVGSIATSYIPTTTAAVTRGADVISKTGVSSLIGQTEGTLYADLTYDSLSTTSSQWFSIFGSSNSIGLALSNGNRIRSIVNGQSDVLSSAPLVTLGVKIAWAYNASGVVCFVNGTQYTLTNGGAQVITQLNSIAIDNTAFSTRIANTRIRSVALYTTRLTNAQLQALTT